ncbi:MAG: purine-nucleoside phosphorylase [Cyanobacteria bacterium SZAS LIN-5]|nr:purine-nucleoside phosphorylase [Cyanobacteria bacterium SZAS LIN-5]
MKTESWNIEAKSASSSVGILKAACKRVPDAAVVLGSGVKVLMDLHDPVALPFEEVFGIAPTIAGHAGSIVVGRLVEAPDGPLVAVLRGRFHLYEGHDWSVVTLPARVLVEWGVPKLFLTNAAGGLNKSFNVGDLMVLTGYRDFLNPEHKEKGLVSALMKDSVACANALTDKVIEIGKKLSGADQSFVPLRQGTYAACLGPSYETMAEIEMLRRLNADAVGMSTVPELLTAAGTGTVAAAISVVTNVWKEGEAMGGHEEVLEASKQASLRLDKLFHAVLTSI